ncbi:SNF2-related protein [Persicobacter psychrovividus]|uniref:DEAD/DEAH box helicase n=1 Tax=Persicobacter psychrovividus TaxID=387638 RepID=A0ABM7VJ82_9BACT|nr:DEAD/DEAH box helicase [Persicobacter psychrovividus]
MNLYDYQESNAQKAFQTVKTHQHAYLCFEVRTGKTLTALRTADLLGASRVLFITKKKAIPSIESDFDAYSSSYRPTFSLLVTNYEQVKKLAPEYDLVVVDEAHNIGAFPKPSIRQGQVREICQQAKYVLFLSGTPSPETWSQLYHQLQVLPHNPFAKFPSFYSWAQQYVEVYTQRIGGRVINKYDKANVEAIKSVTDPFMLSFTQEEAGFECPVSENFMEVKMKPATVRHAKNLRTGKPVIINGQEIMAEAPNVIMNKVHQLSGGTIIPDLEQDSFLIDDTKVRFIKREFKQFERLAIVYKFKGERLLLIDKLKNYTEDVEAFKSGKFRYFIGQVSSIKEGVDLSSADALVMYNVDYSAAAYLQTRARLQKKSRRQEVLIFWLFSNIGFEQLVYDTLQEKKRFTVHHYQKAMF